MRIRYHATLRFLAVFLCIGRSLYFLSIGIHQGALLGFVDGVIISAILIASTNKAASEDKK